MRIADIPGRVKLATAKRKESPKEPPRDRREYFKKYHERIRKQKRKSTKKKVEEKTKRLPYFKTKENEHIGEYQRILDYMKSITPKSK